LRFLKIVLAICALLLAGISPLCAAGNRAIPKPSAASAPTDAAAVALFVNSNLDSARALAATAARSHPAQIDAWFVEMEAAALEADANGELQAALRICEIGYHSGDPRVLIAAARIADLAGNTTLFRNALPRIEKLIASGGAPVDFLRRALLQAAADGVSNLSELDLAHASGLLTDWRVDGPFGIYPSIAFGRVFAPEFDNLAQATYEGRAVEDFRFEDGDFVLPDYFSSTGIFYASSEMKVPATSYYSLRAESGGTLEIFVDGVSRLKKDTRWRTTPELAEAALPLSAGVHKLLVKFLPSATPFQVALRPIGAPGPPSTPATGAMPGLPPMEAGYVAAALRFWRGEYDAALAELTELHKKQPSVAVDLLLAQTWERGTGEAPEEMALLQSALRQAPLAWAAEYQLARLAYEAGHYDEAFARAHRLVAARPANDEAQHLLAEAALKLKAQAEAATALDAETQLHPSCRVLRSAAIVFSSLAAYERAAQFERRLEGCAPGSLAYAGALAEEGHHRQAAAAAQQVVASHPLDRGARTLLVSELAMAEEHDAARRAARELVTIAPQSVPARDLAAAVNAGTAVFDQPSVRSSTFAGSQEFYSAYRRNGLEIIHEAARRKFSGGPAVVLLEDRIVALDAAGGVSLYVHRITRVLDREGIEKYGEVALPHTASVLELRTMKADGTIVEPDLTPNKSTVSMPALAVNDAIELEYVIHYPFGGVEENPEAFRCVFGSFMAPMLDARFISITPLASPLEVISSPGAPPKTETTANGATVRSWEQEDIGQSAEEVSTPRGDMLPTVRLVATRAGGWQDVRDFYREELIEAARVGARVEQTARELHAATGEETARALYRFVTTRLRSTESDFESGDITPAESTLANYNGSRTATLIALARVAGLDAELLLAREADTPRPSTATRDAYIHPLVRFYFADKEVAADAEQEGLGFGVLPPTIAADDALVVRDVETTAPRLPSEALFTRVPASLGDELSTADGDLVFDEQGNMSAQLTIRLGAARSAQLRGILTGTEPRERQHLIEQMAMRVFPGATSASGEIHNENDPDLPLEVRMTCHAPHLLNFSGSTADLDQLAPPLGLRQLYGVGVRLWPLYIDVPLIETTTFHVHLPEGVEVAGLAEDFNLQTEFGTYSVEFRRAGPHQIEVRRTFRVPVQVIPPGRFPAFANFERQIDEAEQQHLTLARGHETSPPGNP
jgi:tetratricopeptide (TPR) repeat protein